MGSKRNKTLEEKLRDSMDACSCEQMCNRCALEYYAANVVNRLRDRLGSELGVNPDSTNEGWRPDRLSQQRWGGAGPDCSTRPAHGGRLARKVA